MAGVPLIASVALGGLLAFAAVLLSFRHMYHHLKHYNRPDYQLHIVRILAMVPIYSTTSWLQLIVKEERTKLMLELFRDSYEAYVIYNFVVLLIKYAGGDYHLSRYLEGRPRIAHSWPLSLWLPPMKPGPAFLNFIRATCLQFVLLKPLGALAKLYAFERWNHQAQIAVRIILYLINNASVSTALYGLVLFYHAAYDILKQHHPFPKFISVKAVVFFSFWQGIAIQIAIRAGLISPVEGVTTIEQAAGLQDILICFEMFIAAVAHYYVFSYKEYLSDEDHRHGDQYGLVRNFTDIFDFRDVLSDARDRLRGGVGFGTELRDGAPVASMQDVLSDPVRGNTGSYGSMKSRYEPITINTNMDVRRNGWLPNATLDADRKRNQK